MPCRTILVVKHKPLLAIAVLLALSTALAAQLVTVPDEPDPDYCLEVEHIRANLHVPSPANVVGRILDQTGAPLKDSRVELRRYVSEREQISTKAVNTDADGKFELGTVTKGDYRLLASPSRAFKQPEELWCSSEAKCFLEIRLQANPSDLPDSQCPIR